MNQLTILGVLAICALPVLGATETWQNVPIVDVACSAKVNVNPDAHTKDCALQCSKTGFALITSAGAVLKFDGEGNRQALEALKSANKKHHLRGSVTGERNGDVIKVLSLKM